MECMDQQEHGFKFLTKSHFLPNNIKAVTLNKVQLTSTSFVLVYISHVFTGRYVNGKNIIENICRITYQQENTFY